MLAMGYTKTVVIGLDAATWDVIKPLMNSGRLSTLKSLCESGVSGVLKSTIPPLTPPAWTSMATGVNPGKHGIYDFMEQDSETHEVRPLNYSRMHRKTIWDVFSEAGKKVIIANFPMAYPPPRVNGIFISGISSPEEGMICYPKSLKETLKNYKYRIHPEVSYTDVGSKDYIKHLKNLMKMRFDLYTHLVKTYEWDLFWGVFNEIDWAQHYVWYEKKLLFSLYEYFDTLLEAFLKEVQEENCNIWICSDHGMKEIKGEIHFNNLLVDWGVLQLKLDSKPSNKRGNMLRSLAHKFGIQKKARIKRHLPTWTIKFLKRMMGNHASCNQYERIKWEESLAYSFGYLGKVYFNKGRQFSGVELKELKHKIIELKNPYSGENIFSQIYEKDELYSGDYLSDAPDLILIPENWNYMIYNDFAYEWITEPKDRYADHYPEGVFIAKSSILLKGKELNMDICDIMPNILVMHELPIFDDLDGQVKKALFDNDVLIKKLPHSLKSDSSGEGKYSDRDREDIEKSLKNLGYM